MSHKVKDFSQKALKVLLTFAMLLSSASSSVVTAYEVDTAQIEEAFESIENEVSIFGETDGDEPSGEIIIEENQKGLEQEKQIEENSDKREHLEVERDDAETSDEVGFGEMNGDQTEKRLTSVEETEGETIPMTTSSLPATGGTVLAGETVVIDQDITGRITVNGGTLILNDNYTITGTVVVNNGGSFEMSDGLITGISNGVEVRAMSSFEMSGKAEISGNTGTGVTTSLSSTFKMSGNAVISNNVQNGVDVMSIDSTFEMTGNTVINNTGVGVDVIGIDSTFEMSGNAVISNNTGAAGVRVSTNGTFKMSGNTVISNNSSGGVRVSTNGSFEMSGNAMISNNAGRDGGGIFVVNSGTFTAISGSIINNNASGDGGGIYTEAFEYADPLTNMDAYSNLTISDDVIFSGNTAGNGSFFPPSNATTFLPSIETTSTSIVGISHPLNNDDINFRYGSPLVHHTVSFNLHGGVAEADFAPQTVLDGELANKPATNPIRTGYTFAGWFTSSTGNTTFDFATPITEDTEIHAQWEEATTDGEETHTVTFNLHGGAEEADFRPQTVLDGELADEPATNPTRTGYKFEGWFTSSTGNTAFDFDTPITEDTVIHAQWEEATTDGRDNEENNNNNNNNNNNTPNRRLPQTGAVAGSALGIGGAILIIGLAIAKKKKSKD